MIEPQRPLSARFADLIDRRWVQLVLIAWAVLAIWFVTQRWNAIRWLALADTDDNMRLMQVRALLAGQGWFDLTNYRLDPPRGFNIHWSRIVDLPIAALILILRPFAGPVWAERLAVGIAPLLPLSIALLGVAATVRRLVSPYAWPLAIVFLTGAVTTMLMFMPERIDHHGWQLAMLSLTLAGLVDPQARRGGIMVGLASAVSLTIGLELLPYAAMAGAIIALRWAWDRGEALGMLSYALSLGGGAAAGFVVFASNANRVMRCDALTPVWLSTVVLAAALLAALAWWSPARREIRFGAVMIAGGIVAAFFVGAFPQCLGRPEQVSQELYDSWLNNVREAKPIYRHPIRTAIPMAILPLIGLIGAITALRRAETVEQRIGWVSATAFAGFAAAMLLWQVRAAPAAQLLAIPAVTLLGWLLLPWLLRHRSMPVRVFGTVGGFLLVSGLFAGLVLKWFPSVAANATVQKVNRATARCMTLPAMAPLNRIPAATMFTFVDMGPRLITLTHHDAVAGPYHRNGDAILDVQHAFKRSPEEARAIMLRHGARYLLVCPNMSESTVYRAKAPDGFYDQLAHNAHFDWLTPVPLPKGSPLRLFRIR